MFETGRSGWGEFDAWRARAAKPRTLFLDGGGKLSWQQPSNAAYDEYLADPNKPVPYVGHIVMGMRPDYMTEDQRFAAERPDVLVYKTERLDRDIRIDGPVSVELKVPTTGTDSDCVVKLIDVYPGDYPDYNNPPAPPLPPGAPPRVEPANTIKMGGYQQLVRGEPFRGKFRKSFEHPIPFEPGKQDRIAFRMPDVPQAFRAGHRIMVQVQSSW